VRVVVDDEKIKERILGLIEEFLSILTLRISMKKK
jgi:hypothetical protein